MSYSESQLVSTMVSPASPFKTPVSPCPATPSAKQPKRKKSAATKSKSQKPTEKSKNHIPRPRNAFMLYRSDYLKCHHTPNTCPKYIGMRWRSLSALQRAPWERAAEEDRKEHRKKYPNYVFKPIHNNKTKKKKKNVKLEVVESPDTKHYTWLKLEEIHIQDSSNESLPYTHNVPHTFQAQQDTTVEDRKGVYVSSFNPPPYLVQQERESCRFSDTGRMSPSLPQYDNVGAPPPYSLHATPSHEFTSESYPSPHPYFSNLTNYSTLQAFPEGTDFATPGSHSSYPDPITDQSILQAFPEDIDFQTPYLITDHLTIQSSEGMDFATPWSHTS